MPKSVISLSDVEHAVLTMATVASENEKYFGDLDGEMGDADFGKSLAQGFRAVQNEFDKIDHSDIGVLLLKCGMIFAANVGGCSGPIWGTAFMRAGMTAKGKQTLTLGDVVAMGRNAVEGMRARGGASQGDKTLLDAIIPAIDKIEEFSKTDSDDVLGAFGRRQKRLPPPSRTHGAGWQSVAVLPMPAKELSERLTRESSP